MGTISISTCFDYSVSIENQLGMIRDAGFDCVSIGESYEHSGILDGDRLKRFKLISTENRLPVDTVHGYQLDKPGAVDINQLVVRAAVTLDTPVVVLHCSAFTFDPGTLEDRRRDVRKKLEALELISRASGVRFALENVLPGIATEFMEEMLAATDPSYFGFCYDSSHDQIDGPRDFGLLERNMGRLIAVHLSDRIREFVDHVLPGEGFIDFAALGALLRQAQIGFPLLMEVMTANSSLKDTRTFLRIARLEALNLDEQIR